MIYCMLDLFYISPFFQDLHIYRKLGVAEPLKILGVAMMGVGVGWAGDA